MRIIGGSAKGRKFKVPKGFDSRPTTDFARESLFNILNHRIDFNGIRALDLCSGTGSLSYELASRGANEVIAVDKNVRCVAYVKEQIMKFQLPQVRVIKTDVKRFLEKVSGNFDLILADPPFDIQPFEQWLKIIVSRGLLEENGLIVLEHGGEVNYSSFDSHQETRKYGQVHFSFFTLDKHE